MGKLDGLEPSAVFRYFEELSRIPRGSGNEAGAASYIENFGRTLGLKTSRDAADNVLIKKEASKGHEESPGVIIQGHIDMVCEKDEGVIHDFGRDPLELETDGEFVRARGTTLGGDDGIAAAMAMAILADDSLEHPKLECLFTTGEEIGLLGAAALDASDIDGRMLINIDSEEEGILTVGCAGGMCCGCIYDVSYEEAEGLIYSVAVEGLLGGHSGTEIDKGRANSNVLMGRLLYALSKSAGFGIHALTGGNTDNAIAARTDAVLVVGEDDARAFEDSLRRTGEIFSAEYATSDPGVKVSFKNVGFGTRKVLTEKSASDLIFLMHMAPDGVVRRSADMEDLVETSLNLGVLRLDEDEARLIFCVRSSVESQKREIGEKLRHITEYAGGRYEEKGDYPGWKYNPKSRLKDICVDVYRRMYRREPEVLAIHAGLECGLFCGKIEGLDCVSIGPDLYDIHTPKERLSVASTKRVYEFVLEVLKSL